MLLQLQLLSSYAGLYNTLSSLQAWYYSSILLLLLLPYIVSMCAQLFEVRAYKFVFLIGIKADWMKLIEKRGRAELPFVACGKQLSAYLSQHTYICVAWMGLRPAWAAWAAGNTSQMIAMASRA